MSARTDGLPNNTHGIRTHAEVAEIVGLTKMRVKQIEDQAIRRMRNHPIIRQLAIDNGWLPESEES